MLGCSYSYCIVFLFLQYNAHTANESKAPFFSEKQVLTYEIADKMLRIPVL